MLGLGFLGSKDISHCIGFFVPDEFFYRVINNDRINK